jgi:hypothetical protein
MSKHYAYQVRLQDKFTLALRDAYRMVADCHYPQAKLTELKNAAYYNNPLRSKLTAHSEGYVTGYDSAMFDSFRSANVTYGYWVNDKFYQSGGKGELTGELCQYITEHNIPCLCVYKDDFTKEF